MAALDPLWAILSDPGKRFNRWDYEDFFSTGTEEVDKLVAEATRFGRPAQWNRALDFGCGVGRLTRALQAYFRECHGVDISREMVRKAREITPECFFHVNTQANLKLFEDSYFDFIYSVIVLQHQPNRTVALGYVAEFLRILGKEGLLVFQLPSHIPLRNRIQGRRRLYSLLRRMGWNSNFLYRSLKLTPIRMVHVPEKDVISVIRSCGGKVLDVRPDERAGPFAQSRTYYVTR
ncbi:MAG TPA: class I SAM-dependent methyltransferase [Candidatus Acidoferrum sp.]|nr:class I SAM-dependent methyltransferase [Candidatus Acidoferrum sp.]